jgi:hypothetical protein
MGFVGVWVCLVWGCLGPGGTARQSARQGPRPYSVTTDGWAVVLCNADWQSGLQGTGTRRVCLWAVGVCCNHGNGVRGFLGFVCVCGGGVLRFRTSSACGPVLLSVPPSPCFGESLC